MLAYQRQHDGQRDTRPGDMLIVVRMLYLALHPSVDANNWKMILKPEVQMS